MLGRARAEHHQSRSPSGASHRQAYPHPRARCGNLRGATMPSLRRFSWSPNWFIIWAEGRRSRRLSTGTSDKKEAESALARFNAAQARPPENFDINKLCDAYLEDRKPVVRAFRNLELSFKAPRDHFGLLHPNYINRALVRAY